MIFSPIIFWKYFKPFSDFYIVDFKQVYDTCDKSYNTCEIII